MKHRVFLYCRKSSEGEDRQVLSIQSQLNELKKTAQKLNLEIVGKPFEEAKSAKAPGRPVFSDMMDRLNKGEAEGILCWKLDRLARNPVDGGSVIWAMKTQKIDIYTPFQIFSQGSDSVLLMYVEFGMAQKFIDDLGKNAQRGMRTKAEEGWYPAPAPLGYLNTPSLKKGFKILTVDPKRFSLVRKLFEEVLNGKQAIDVWYEARDSWKLTSQKGSPISRSAIYFMLTNPFYYGEYEWPKRSGNWYVGKHKPLISKEEFDLVQKRLGVRGRPIARKHTFDLTGLFLCGECGCSITATKKTKHFIGTNRTATYTYYHCTRKNRNILCTQPPIKESDFVNQIDQYLDKLRPDPDFVEWARKWLKVVNNEESKVQENIMESQHEAILMVEKRLNKLLDIYLDEGISEPVYQQKKRQLEQEKKALEDKLGQTSKDGQGNREKIETALEFALLAQKKFHEGDRNAKRYIITAIGSNFVLKDKKVRIDLHSHFKELSEKEKWNEKYKDWLEPQKYTDIFAKLPDLRPANPTWLPD